MLFHLLFLLLLGNIVGTETPKHRSPRSSHKPFKISYAESVEAEYHNIDEPKDFRRVSRSSRRDRVHPEGTRRPSRAMDGSGKSRSKKLTVHTGFYEEERQSTPSHNSTSVRGSRDLRSPGAKKTPIASAAKHPSDNPVIPDFITQTDANGNATTPRSAAAIEGAQKTHPQGPRPKLHVDRRGQLAEDDSDDDGTKDQVYSPDDPCDMLLDSLRMMCCCFMDEGKPGKTITGQLTEESDDRPKLLGDLHPDDHGKKCLVLDLDETLVHSSFRAVPNSDFVIPVQVRCWLDSLLRRSTLKRDLTLLP